MESLLHDPAYRQRIFRQWEKLQRGEQVDRRLVRDPVYDSWIRCRKRGLNAEYPCIPTLAPEELALIQEEEVFLLQAAVPIIQRLTTGNGNTFVLANAQGIVLRVFPDRGSVKGRVRPGHLKRETRQGTSGLATALYIREPVEIVAEEHFCRSYHHHICAAAPIYRAGTMAGAVSATAAGGEYHPHTLSLVRMTAEAITEQMRLYDVLAAQKALIEIVDDGIVLFRADGVISTANARATAILGLGAPPVGSSLRSLPLPFPIQQWITQGRAFTREQSLLHLPDKSTRSCLFSFLPADGADEGALVFKETSAGRETPTRLTGSGAKHTFSSLIGHSPVLRETVRQARVIAQKDISVLILGESGTGKELFAQAIHNASRRRHGPFVVVNCGALPRDLVQSELFGYVEGAFTGADRRGRPGKFELADGGSIFLDEVGDMPLEAQASLLRLVQNKEVIRIGDKGARRVDVRILAATNADLAESIRRKAFRPDLFYRLNGFPLRIPPLRERPGDIEELALFFLNRVIAHSPECPGRLFAPEALEALKLHPWPGNVRELENTVERSVYLSTDYLIRVDDLEGLAPPLWTGKTDREPADAPASSMGEKWEIERALTLHRGDVNAAAETLGVARSTLYLKLTAHGIRPATFRTLQCRKPEAAILSGLTPIQMRKLLRLLDE